MTELITRQEKQLDNLVQAGYDQFSTQWREPGQTRAACDHWLEAWELVKQMVTPEMRSVEAFDEEHPSPQYPLLNWASDLEMELHNAGIKDSRYFEHRIRFVHEYLTHFPDEDGDGYVNLKRAEGEALWLLDRQPDRQNTTQECAMYSFTHFRTSLCANWRWRPDTVRPASASASTPAIPAIQMDLWPES